MSGLGVSLSGDALFGSLSPVEVDSLVSWVRSSGAETFVEIGTLFGFTARKVAAGTGLRTIAVDDFSWNPFGLPPDRHEAFTRKILEGSPVELLRMRSEEFLSSFSDLDPEKTFVFLDGSHAYDDVKREISLCQKRGVSFIAGHDFGNKAFGVTKAVEELLTSPDRVSLTCWFKGLRAV